MDRESKLLEILNKRGITDSAEIEEFLSMRPKKTYDPFLLIDMDEGVDLVLSAVDNGEKICIYGDYDADGVTATVILMEVLSQLTDDLMYYIPSRFDEGYGLNVDAVRKIHAAGTGLIITVDCGSVSVGEVALAHELGMKVLVTDHHRVTDALADCPVINPSRPECEYPFRYLAGCGVAFKLAQALTTELGLSKKVLTRTLDLVALGTIGDIVPLIDENRTLVKYGLYAINLRERKNLDILIEMAGLTPGSINAGRVSFGIVPNLNAAGRIEHAARAVEFLLAKDEPEIRAGAEELIKYNRGRKVTQERIAKNCIDIVQREYPEDPFLVLMPEDSDEGVNGNVASNVKERFWRPTIIVAKTEDGRYKGTGRSIPGIDLYDTLKKYENLFVTFGGHAGACGFTMNADHTDELRTGLNRDISARIAQEPGLLKKHIDAELELDAADMRIGLAKELELLEPCGQSNPRPRISITAVATSISRIGTDGKYLRFNAKLSDSVYVQCVAFKDADEITAVINDDPEGRCRFTGIMEIDSWNGRERLKMHVMQAERI